MDLGPPSGCMREVNEAYKPIDIKYMDILTGKIWVANMNITYWPVRSSSRWREDWGKRMNEGLF